MITTLYLPFSGRNFEGMESYVLRPMTTALRGVLVSWAVGSGVIVVVDVGDGGGRLVTRAKNWRSALRGGQGREPLRPMPREGVVATMRVRGGRGGPEVGEGEVDMLGWWGGGRGRGRSGWTNDGTREGAQRRRGSVSM